MSIYISTSVWRMRGLDSTAKYVLLRLADMANDNGHAYPSISRIAEDTEISRSSVCRALNILEKERIVLRQRDPKRTQYFLNLDRISCFNAEGKESHGDTSPTETLVSGWDQSSPTVTLEVVPLCDPTSPTVTHKPSLTVNETVSKSSSPNGSSSKESWRDSFRKGVDEAGSVSLPDDASQELRESWERWHEYRSSRALESQNKSSALEWTKKAAEAEVRNIVRYLPSLGELLIIGQVDSAISGNWQGLNLNKVRPPNASTAPTNGSHYPSQRLNPNMCS